MIDGICDTITYAGILTEMILQTHDKLELLGDKMPHIFDMLEQELRKHIEEARMENEKSLKNARDVITSEIEDIKIRNDVDSKKIISLSRTTDRFQKETNSKLVGILNKENFIYALRPVLKELQDEIYKHIFEVS